jgi:hypothetical protein
VLPPGLGDTVDWSAGDLSSGAWLVLVEDGGVWSSFFSHAPNSSAHANIAAQSETNLRFFIVTPPFSPGKFCRQFLFGDRFTRKLLIRERAASFS